jgi:hypothetical protein
MDTLLLAEAVSAVERDARFWLAHVTTPELNALEVAVMERDRSTRTKAGREAKQTIDRTWRRARIRIRLELDPTMPCLREKLRGRWCTDDGREIVLSPSWFEENANSVCCCGGDVLDELTDEQVDALQALTPSRRRRELLRLSAHLHTRRRPRRKPTPARPVVIASMPPEPERQVVIAARPEPEPVPPPVYSTSTRDLSGRFRSGPAGEGEIGWLMRQRW